MESQEEMIKDPVCGMLKPKSQMKFSSQYGGKTYYFCSEMDKNMFEKYPDRWVGGDK